jgi:hypothetical protein
VDTVKEQAPKSSLDLRFAALVSVSISMYSSESRLVRGPVSVPPPVSTPVSLPETEPERWLNQESLHDSLSHLCSLSESATTGVPMTLSSFV